MSGNNIGGRSFGDGVGFENDPYSILDELLHDETEETVISTRNKYFGQAVKIFLEDNNFKFIESPVTEPRIVVSLKDYSFKFIDHMEDMVSIDMPYDWDIMENDIKDHIKNNPITQTEIHVTDMTQWDNDPQRQVEKKNTLRYVKEIQSRLNVSPTDAIKIAEQYTKRLLSGKGKDGNVGESVYSSSIKPELTIKSGVYNNLSFLIRENDLEKEFNKNHKNTLVRWMNDNQETPNLENTLLTEMGFEHILGKIQIDENPFISNRIITVEFDGQDQFQIPTFTEDDFKMIVDADGKSIPEPIEE